MSKTFKIYIFLFVLVFAFIVIIDSNKKKPVDWRETYNINDKIPYGLFVFNKEVKHLFNKQSITRFSQTPYEYFDNLYNYQDSTYQINGTFLYINANEYLDEQSTNEIIYFAAHGNDVFLSTKSLPQILLDSLEINIGYSNKFTENSSIYINKNKNKKYNIDKGSFTDGYISKYNTETSEILGYQEFKDSTYINFIRVPYKAGNFYIHLQPMVFTNYFLLKNKNYTYTEELSNYINGDIYWFAQDNYSSKSTGSSLSFIHNNKELNAAWLLFLISILFFMLFNSKRKQRIVPIIEPLQNTTVDFAKTIGNLYFNEKNHKDILDKKIIYLLEKIRNEYYLETFVLDQTFVNRLQAKSGKNQEDLEKLVSIINKNRKKISATEQDLIELNQIIEKINL